MAKSTRHPDLAGLCLAGLVTLLASCAPSQSRESEDLEQALAGSALAGATERAINGRWAVSAAGCEVGQTLQAGVMTVKPQEIQVDLLLCEIAESAQPSSNNWRFYGQCSDADGTALVRDFDLELVDEGHLRWNNPGTGRVQRYSRCTGGAPNE